MLEVHLMFISYYLCNFERRFSWVQGVKKEILWYFALGGLCCYHPTWERPRVKRPSCSHHHSHIIPLWSVLIFSLSCSSEILPSYKLSSTNRNSLKNPQAAGPCNAPLDKLQKRTKREKKLKPTWCGWTVEIQGSQIPWICFNWSCDLFS